MSLRSPKVKGCSALVTFLMEVTEKLTKVKASAFTFQRKISRVGHIHSSVGRWW